MMTECNEKQPMRCKRDEMDVLFRTKECLPIETMVNSGRRNIDIPGREVHNDVHWRGFFPADHVFTLFGRFVPLPAGFKKQFKKEDGEYGGVTTDGDGIIRGRNRLKEVVFKGRKYIHLTYSELWNRPFYDLLLPINEDVVIGKAYLGTFPYGIELLTFAMARRYSFENLSPADHRELFDSGSAPKASDIEGKWRGQLVSNAALSHSFFVLSFTLNEDKVDGRWKLLGVWEGESKVELGEDAMRMFDFTSWHDEIRKVTDEVMVGKYCQPDKSLLPPPWAGSLGHIHSEDTGKGKRLCLYYILNKIRE